MMMKRMTSVFLIAAMITTLLSGCGNGGSAQEPESSAAVTFEGTMEALAEKIVEERPVEFAGGIVVPDLTDDSEETQWAVKSYTGLDDTGSITDAAVYEPMIGSIAFSLVLVRVSPDAETQTVAEAMKNGIDPRKWICVEADDLKVAGCGDVVMLIMVDSSTDLTAQSFIDAFQTVIGAEAEFVL